MYPYVFSNFTKSNLYLLTGESNCIIDLIFYFAPFQINHPLLTFDLR